MDFSEKSDYTNKNQLIFRNFIAIKSLRFVDKSVHNIALIFYKKSTDFYNYMGQVLTGAYSAASNSHSS